MCFWPLRHLLRFSGFEQFLPVECPSVTTKVHVFSIGSKLEGEK